MLPAALHLNEKDKGFMENVTYEMIGTLNLPAKAAFKAWL